jgi:hypothetical protein
MSVLIVLYLYGWALDTGQRPARGRTVSHGRNDICAVLAFAEFCRSIHRKVTDADIPVSRAEKSLRSLLAQTGDLRRREAGLRATTQEDYGTAHMSG